MPGRAAKPSRAVSTWAGPSGGASAGRTVGSPDEGAGAGPVAADAAGTAAGGATGTVAGDVSTIATSGAPELSLFVATNRAVAHAMLSVMKAIRPLLLPAHPAARRRGSFCCSADRRRMGFCPCTLSPSGVNSRLGRSGAPRVSSGGVGSMPDNVRSLWPLGPVSALDESGLVLSLNSRRMRPSNGFDARYQPGVESASRAGKEQA